MEKWKPFVELKTQSGTPIRHGDITLTPEAQALLVKLPFGGFVWNRPAAIIVEQSGRRERIEIHDVTRAAVLVMAAVGAAAAAGAFLARLLAR